MNAKRDQRLAVVRRLIDDRAERRLKRAVLDANRHVVRQLTERCDLRLEPSNAALVLLDEQIDELHARQPIARRVRGQRLKHDQRRAWLASRVPAGSGESVDEQESWWSHTELLNADRLLCHDGNPAVEIRTKHSVLGRGVRVLVPQDRVGHSNSIARAPDSRGCEVRDAACVVTRATRPTV